MVVHNVADYVVFRREVMRFLHKLYERSMTMLTKCSHVVSAIGYAHNYNDLQCFVFSDAIYFGRWVKIRYGREKKERREARKSKGKKSKKQKQEKGTKDSKNEKSKQRKQHKRKAGRLKNKDFLKRHKQSRKRKAQKEGKQTSRKNEQNTDKKEDRYEEKKERIKRKRINKPYKEYKKT